MANKGTTIVIEGRVGYKAEITPLQAARIIEFLEPDEEGKTADLGTARREESEKEPDGRQGAGGGPPKVTTPRGALEVSGAKTMAEKITALGAFLLQGERETFTSDEVLAEFRAARESAPKNFPRDIGAAVAANWVASAREGGYYLTSKVDGILDGDFKFPKAARSSNGRGKSSAKGETPEVFKEIDEWEKRFEGVAPYSKMKTGKDRLLWVVFLAKKNGIIKGLANKEITWLTDHLGSGIPAGDVAGYFRGARAGGYANRSIADKTIRITEEGEAYLKTVGVTAGG